MGTILICTYPTRRVYHGKAYSVPEATANGWTTGHDVPYRDHVLRHPRLQGRGCHCQWHAQVHVVEAQVGERAVLRAPHQRDHVPHPDTQAYQEGVGPYCWSYLAVRSEPRF